MFLTFIFFFQDLRNQLYEYYYLNFISAISRSKLEDIANAALGASAVAQVAKVKYIIPNIHIGVPVTFKTDSTSFLECGVLKLGVGKIGYFSLCRLELFCKDNTAIAYKPLLFLK